MFRNLSDPLHPGIFHPYIWIQSLCYRLSNNRLPFFLQEFNLFLFSGDESIDSGCFFVEEFGNLFLGFEGGDK